MAQHRADRPRPLPTYPPTRLDAFPAAAVPPRPTVRPADAHRSAPDDVDAATVYVPSSGELRRPLEDARDPRGADRFDRDEPLVTYDGVAPLVVFVVLVVLLLVGLLVVVPWVVT